MTYRITEDDIREVRAQGDLKALLTAARTQGTADAARNRAAVLAHPDLAEQLCVAPCKFAAPEMWTGYIGPKWIEGRHGEAVLNTSPYRAQLVALVAEAEQRNTRKDAAA
ncbi:hypothetical protein [Streptodolium elevatio]|uniref:Uncharacterized protein n=1 Tax=Streptodolium elevatio TaxID=3157996 RepID=A0ABV3DJY1_9ACTN